MKSLRRSFLVPGLVAIALLLLLILASTRPALVQGPTRESGGASAGDGHSLTITGLNVPVAAGEATAGLAYQVVAPETLVNDGSFEKSPSDWLENDTTGCIPWIDDWSATLGISAHHGARYFWAGGACGPQDQTPAPNSNSAEQRVSVPATQTALSFWYYAERVDPDDVDSRDFAYVEVNGNRVWELDMVTANNTRGWVNATVDLSTYAGQNALLKLGAINDPIGGVGNVLFDFVEFVDPVPVVGLIDPETGGTLTYTNPDGLVTIITVPPGAVTDTIALAYTPRSDPGHPLGSLEFANQAFDLDGLEHFLYLPSILKAPAAGDRLAATVNDDTAAGTGSLARAATSYTFLEPVNIVINYSDANVPGDELDLRLYYWTGSEWQDAVTTCSPQSGYQINETLNTITLSICHLSRFSVVGAG